MFGSWVTLRSDKMSQVNSNVNLNKRSDRALVMTIVAQQDATMCSLLYFCKLLYMFRVVTLPIIRSTYNCNYSIWHWSNFGECSVWSLLKVSVMNPSLLPSANLRPRKIAQLHSIPWWHGFHNNFFFFTESQTLRKINFGVKFDSFALRGNP
jgi:hypothetical protein